MAVSVNNLQYKYDKDTILDDINFDFEKGMFYGIIGPNGSGKTTLLKLIAKILNTPSDKIYIQNKDINSYKDKEKARQISLVPQIFNIEYSFTVYDIVSMGRYPYKMDKLSHNDKKIINETLELTNLYDYKDKYVNNLSGGELQRVILARAIAQQTKIMLLDEPLSHLDIHHQLDILNLSKKLCKEKDITIICVLHDLNLAMKYSDKLIMLNKGKIYDAGDTKDVLNKKNIEEIYGIKVDIISQNLSNVIMF